MPGSLMRRYHALFALCLGTLLLAWAPLSSANVVLTYNGPGFDSFYPLGSPPVTYTTANHVTGTLVLSGPLGANWNGVYVTPVSFSFSDGVNTLTSANMLSYFYFGTNAAGVITFWGAEMDADVGNTVLSIATVYNPASHLLTDFGSDQLCSTPASGYSCGVNAVGTARGQFKNVVSPLPEGTGWSVSSTAVPEPASLLLFGAGLAGLAGWRKLGRKRGDPVAA